MGETGSQILQTQIDAGKENEATEYFDFAMQYFKRNQFKEAIINYEKAIKYDPDYGEAYINLAIAYAKNDENQKAIHTLERVLEKDPDSSYLAHLNMAQVYKRFNNEKAEKSYKAAIELNPFLHDAYFSFGEFYWNLKKQKQAVEILKQGLELYNLESFYSGAVKEGIKSYSECPELVADLELILEQNISNEKIKKYDTMVFDHYYAKNNSYIAEKYDQVGYYYLRIGEFKAASEYFNKSIQCWNSQKNRAYQHLESAEKYLEKENINQ